MPPQADRLIHIHSLLDDILKSIRQDVRSSNLLDGFPILEDAFAQWIAFEDKDFFLYLENKSGFCDVHSLELLRFFQSDLKHIQIEIVEFLEFYGWGRSLDAAQRNMLPLAFMKLAQRVYDRMDMEKDYLISFLPQHN